MLAPPHDAPPFYPKKLLKKLDNDHELFKAVVKAMKRDLDARIIRLGLARMQHDRPSATAESHALKGALAEVTATSCSYLASILERASDAKDWETFDVAFEEFRIDAAKLTEAIDHELGITLAQLQANLRMAGIFPPGEKRD